MAGVWSALGPLRDPGIRGLSGARLAAVFGTSLAPTALAFGVLGLEGGSAAALGLVMAAATIGQVALIAPGGVLADRWSRKGVMVVAETVTGSVLVLLGVIYLAGAATVPTMIVLAGLSGAASGLHYPAATGFVPEISPPESLQSTNGMLRLAANIARILGTACGGLIVALVGPGWAIASSGVMALVAAGLILRLNPRFTAPASTAHSPLADLREGWSEFVARRWVVAIVIVGAVSSLGVTAYLGVLGPVRLSESSGAAGWALIATGTAVGAIVGVAVAMRLRPRRPLVVAVVALGLTSLPIFALAMSAPLAVAVLAGFVSGLSLDVMGVLWETSLQQHVPADVLSRVASFDWLGSFALAPVALIVAGPLVDAFGLTPVLWGAALLAAIPPLAVLVPEVRTLTYPGRRA